MMDEEGNEVITVIRIAICDDEERAVALHKKIVKDSLQTQGIGCEITAYTPVSYTHLTLPTICSV